MRAFLDRARRRLGNPSIQILLGVVFVVLASLLGITNNAFWDDEANTALFARNLIHQGQLTAWDGRNVVSYLGGYELDENLRNILIPPLQYGLAAAGMLVFGETELGARVPFVVLGAFAIGLLGWGARGYLADRRAAAYPALLMALSAACLLFIPQARYFAASLFFATLILALWGRLAVPGRSSRQFLAGKIALGVAASAGLFYANYYMAPAFVAALAPLLLIDKFRTRPHLVFYGLLCLCSLGLVASLLGDSAVSAKLAAREPLAEPLANYLTLLGWHIKGLSAFEFMPVVLVPLLGLAWLARSAQAMRRECLVAIALLLSVLVYILVIALMTQQPVAKTRVADMRYLVPLFGIIALITAIALRTVWAVSRPLSVALAVLVVSTNALHLSPLTLKFNRDLRCTLCDLAAERWQDRTTGTEGYIRALGRLDAGSSVVVRPWHMAAAAQFYVPALTYCNQLDRRSLATITAADKLPACIIAGTGCAAFAVIGGYPAGPDQPAALAARVTIDGCAYTAQAALAIHWRDKSRPEIPWRVFRPLPESYGQQEGIVTFRRIDEPPARDPAATEIRRPGSP
ncbi:MAG: hypothetical protein HQ483_04495 [Rhodospirillales bacterium]|nr:hypothetical protein [Rhodospirillales bacterium]